MVEIFCEIFPSKVRVHTMIEADSDGVTIHDNKSSNGTKKRPLQFFIQRKMKMMRRKVMWIVTHLKPFLMTLMMKMYLLTMFLRLQLLANSLPSKADHLCHLSDLSFVPDSQSSPLPTSAVAIMKNQSQFKIPDSPCSDLNEKKKDGGEAQEAASDQKTETTETSASGREESINDKSDDNYKEVVEETKSEPVSVSGEKVDIHESSASESS